MFKNKKLEELYKELLETHKPSEANYIITNSLAILGDKKIKPIKEDVLNNFSLKRINSYKYPDRLCSFVKITSEKSETWKKYSFTKIAFS